MENVQYIMVYVAVAVGVVVVVVGVVLAVLVECSCKNQRLVENLLQSSWLVIFISGIGVAHIVCDTLNDSSHVENVNKHALVFATTNLHTEKGITPGKSVS